MIMTHDSLVKVRERASSSLLWY